MCIRDIPRGIFTNAHGKVTKTRPGPEAVCKSFAKTIGNIAIPAKRATEVSKKATEKSAKINKARYPQMGTYKNKDGKSYAEEKKKSKSDLKAGKYFTWKGKRYKAGSVTARRAENQMRARKRAQELAKKRLANK